MTAEAKLNNSEEWLVPATDIYETENEYALKLEMPGVAKENLEITLEKDELIIKGNIAENEENEKNVKYSEYSLHNYYKAFKIGNDIDRDTVNANLENGILTLMLKKSEQAKPKKIEITVH